MCNTATLWGFRLRGANDDSAGIHPFLAAKENGHDTRSDVLPESCTFCFNRAQGVSCCQVPTYPGKSVSCLRQQNFFFLQCRHMSFVDFVVLPPGHDRSVTDFWGWDAHEAQLRCPDGVWVVIDIVPGGALNLNSANLPRPWSTRESSPSRKIPTVQPGIEPETS